MVTFQKTLLPIFVYYSGCIWIILINDYNLNSNWESVYVCKAFIFFSSLNSRSQVRISKNITVVVRVFLIITILSSKTLTRCS